MNGDFFIGVISLYTLFKKGRHTYLIESYFSLIQNYRRFSESANFFCLIID